jgi:hypothetical protein
MRGFVLQLNYCFNSAKGVKVDLGIPHEMWDKPPAEVTHLKTQASIMPRVNVY